MRAEPSPSGALVRTIREGTELELIGAEREGGGRRWRNVRDPASGASGWIVSELLAQIATAPPPAAPTGIAGGRAEAGRRAEAELLTRSRAARRPPLRQPRRLPRPTGPRSRRRASATPTGPTWRSSRPRSTRWARRSRRRTSRSSGPAGARRSWRSDLAQGHPGGGRGVRRRRRRRFGRRARARRPARSTDSPRNAADRAEEVGRRAERGLESKDARSLNGVRTTLVRLIGEINNMNLTLLELQ